MTTTETTAKTPTAEFPMYGTDLSDLRHFRTRLAAYCAGYVMEIAKPVMERCEDLFADAAVVCLVDKWFEADREYSHKRQTYLVQWSQYDPDDELSFQPLDSYKWADEKRQAYRTALDALLVR